MWNEGLLKWVTMSTVKMPGTGLEDVGVPGQSFLRDALTSCTDPLKAIEEFQVIIMHVGCTTITCVPLITNT